MIKINSLFLPLSSRTMVFGAELVFKYIAVKKLKGLTEMLLKV